MRILRAKKRNNKKTAPRTARQTRRTKQAPKPAEKPLFEMPPPKPGEAPFTFEGTVSQMEACLAHIRAERGPLPGFETDPYGFIDEAHRNLGAVLVAMHRIDDEILPWLRRLHDGTADTFDLNRTGAGMNHDFVNDQITAARDGATKAIADLIELHDEIRTLQRNIRDERHRATQAEVQS